MAIQTQQNANVSNNDTQPGVVSSTNGPANSTENKNRLNNAYDKLSNFVTNHVIVVLVSSCFMNIIGFIVFGCIVALVETEMVKYLLPAFTFTFHIISFIVGILVYNSAISNISDVLYLVFSGLLSLIYIAWLAFFKSYTPLVASICVRYFNCYASETSILIAGYCIIIFIFVLTLYCLLNSWVIFKRVKSVKNVNKTNDASQSTTQGSNETLLKEADEKKKDAADNKEKSKPAENKKPDDTTIQNQDAAAAAIMEKLKKEADEKKQKEAAAAEAQKKDATTTAEFFNKIINIVATDDKQDSVYKDIINILTIDPIAANQDPAYKNIIQKLKDVAPDDKKVTDAAKDFIEKLNATDAGKDIMKKLKDPVAGKNIMDKLKVIAAAKDFIENLKAAAKDFIEKLKDVATAPKNDLDVDAVANAFQAIIKILNIIAAPTTIITGQ